MTAEQRKIAVTKERNQALVGMIRAVPIMLGYIPIGLAFGLLASTEGLTILNSVAMSLFVFAGSSQFIAVALIGGGATLTAITATVFLVNLRHLLMSAYLAPHFKKMPTWKQLLFSYQLTDESFAVHAVSLRNKALPPDKEIFSLNVFAHLAWLASTALGAWAGGLMTIDAEKYGIDFVLPAMFIGLLLMQLDNLKQVLVAISAAAVSLLLYLQGVSQLYIIIATIIATTLGALISRGEKTVAGEKVLTRKPGEGGESR